jgi:Polyketide cyclase / dehydrase and lipid transport
VSYGFRIERTTPVAAQNIYDRLADAAAWDQWAPMVGRSELAQVGATDPLGAGAIRRIHAPGGLMTVDEEILEARSPSYQRYTVRGLPLPIRDYTGEVHIDEVDGRTRIVWTGQLTPRFAVTGPLIAKFLESAVRRIVDSLIAACSRAPVDGT